MNLATKYRPQEFTDVLSQKAIIKILEQQIKTKTFKNCIMFTGPSGCGKTTIARILANKINNGFGSPIEYDAASNNGVDNVRAIIETAQERSLDSEYKVIVLDEAHMLTIQSWNAFLKCIEEPPKYTIFIFCTTDPQKVPMTIQNRCQIYNLSRIDLESIRNRLNYVCGQENYFVDPNAIDYIAKLSEGSMRQALTYLDKCKDYSINITMNNVVACLGNYSYNVYFDLTNAVIDNNKQTIINIIEQCYAEGTDLKLFISNYLKFILQLTKYTLFKSMTGVDIPVVLEEKVKYTTGIENNVAWFNRYLDKILKLKSLIKNDSDTKTTIEVCLISEN